MCGGGALENGVLDGACRSRLTLARTYRCCRGCAGKPDRNRINPNHSSCYFKAVMDKGTGYVQLIGTTTTCGKSNLIFLSFEMPPLSAFTQVFLYMRAPS